METLSQDQEDAGSPLQALSATQEEVEAVWVRYWAPILSEGGIGRLKGELYDAWHLVNEARKVYRHATGGLCDDLCASAEGIIAMDEARVGRLVEGLQGEVAALQAELEELRRAHNLSPSADT